MTAKIHIERMMHRSSIAVAGDSATTYALVKLIPSGLGSGGSSKAMALNLALVLDVSGSMYEEDGTGVARLKRVQDAAIAAIAKLKPEDNLAIVGFAHNALVLLPSTPVSEKEKIEDVIRRVDMFDVDPGGTAMDEGMALGMLEVEKGTAGLRQVLILTDGETSGEQNCRDLASKAAEKKIHLTLMGVGLDWKASLIKDLAEKSQGAWYYIDVNDKESAQVKFIEEFEKLAATAFTDVEIHLRPMKDIKIKRLRQVAPEIKELQTTEPEDRHLLAPLGTLQHDSASRFIIDMSLPKRPDGKYVIANLEITYDIGTGKRETTGPVPLEMSYTEKGHGYVNAEVMKHIDEIQLKEMSDNLQKALQTNNQEQAKQVAQQMEKKGEIMGKRANKKTMLAKQVLQELNAGGRVSKKTQLAMDDAARMADDVPAGA
jgi:Ca-activated chloride channel homolog